MLDHVGDFIVVEFNPSIPLDGVDEIVAFTVPTVVAEPCLNGLQG
jgi:hypothetical protein